MQLNNIQFNCGLYESAFLFDHHAHNDDDIFLGKSEYLNNCRAEITTGDLVYDERIPLDFALSLDQGN